MGCTASNQLEILVFVGSVRKNSNNRGLVDSLTHSQDFKSLGIQVNAPDLSEIPFFNQDLENQKNIPSSVVQLKKLAKRAHLLLFVTPEYNSSIAPVVKNAYDWLSRPDPDFDNKSVIGGKLAAVISTSYVGQTQVKDCQKMGQYWKLRYYSSPYYVNLGSGVFDEKGNLKSEDEKKKILQWGGELISWVNQNK